MPPIRAARSLDCLSVQPDRLVAAPTGSRPARRTRCPAGGRTPRTAAAPTAASTGLGVADVGVAQHLHHALLVELREALAELLEPAGVERAGRGEDLGREPRDRRERATGVAGVEQRVAELQAGGVDEADDVAGEGLLDRLALGAERGGGVLGGELAAGAVVRDAHAPLEAARADAGEGDAVAVRRVHVGLHLEHERRERAVERRGARRRRRASATATGPGR